MSSHVVQVVFADRAAAYALSAELRRQFDATFDLAVNQADATWIVDVPTPLWRSGRVRELCARYGGQPVE